MLNIGVLISGGGTNLQAIIAETKSGGINGTVKLVISNKEDAYGLERARLSKIKAVYETDEDKIIELLKENNIDLTVVGPEVPLVNGIVDEFEKEGLKIFGPNKECSTFEGSKSFSKDFMIRHNIPTAKYKEYTNLDEAISEIDRFGYPVVLKADGLAAGKGVVIPENREDAINTLKEMMSDKKFGSAGEKIVVEEFLSGIETSI